MTRLRLAWLASVLATFGSLFFSEVLHYVPCELCWYQRIFMYSLFVILTVALFKNDEKVVEYVFPLPFIGGMISLYHYLKQKVKFVDTVSPCTGDVPCSKEYIGWFGFITIPLLALIAFTIISVCFILYFKSVKKEESQN